MAQDLGQVLKYTRLSLLVTLLAGLILVFVDQGQELVVIKAEGGFWSHVTFYIAVVFWALNAWYWARATLAYGARIPYEETCAKPYLGGRLKRVLRLVEHTPRTIGAGAFLLIACAQVKAIFRHGIAPDTQAALGIGSGVTIGLAILFYLFVLYRREIAHWLRRRLDPKQAAHWAETWLEIPVRPAYDPKARVGELPGPVKGIFALLFIMLVAAFLIATFDPVALGSLGPAIVFLVGASLWIAPGTWLLFVARRGDLPVLSIIVALGLGFSFINDNHELRSSEESDLTMLAKRPSLADAVRAWPGSENHEPLVLVATAGGGSRAAYWTASLLGTIHDLHPAFGRQLLGISGVSGGALGAVVYRGLITALPRGGADCVPEPPKQQFPYRTCAQQALASDFLGPALAGTLFPDLVQRILPWGWMPDRAEALERAWERSWTRALGEGHPHARLFALDFLQAWQAAPAGLRQMPALFLNGTSVATGKRIVTSNLDLVGTLSDGFDFFAHWPMRIPLSTAANNASRFPIVEPAGTIKREATITDPNELDRIVDGGYFENFGAATALDILRRLELTDPALIERLVVIQISSDPDYPGVDRGTEGWRQPKAAPASFAGELRSPLQGLLNTRTARGVLAAQRLSDWVQDRGRPFIEFRLIHTKAQTDPPLGWGLSADAMRNIDCQLVQQANQRELAALAKALDFSAAGLDQWLADCAPPPK